VATAAFFDVIEAEVFAILDDTGTSDLNGLTVVRDAMSPERPKSGLDPDGLWAGHEGDGYLDMGGQIGDAAAFVVTAPEAGDYLLSFRYANGGGDRPMALSRDGVRIASPGFAATGAWDQWRAETVVVSLQAGANALTIANIGRGGPNLDRVAISSPSFRIEAESLTLLDRFAVTPSVSASGRAVLQAVGPLEQSAGFVFDRPGGVYDVKIGHFDENDGVARLALLIDGVAVDAFMWDQELGSAVPGPSTLTARTISGVRIEQGALVELRGYGAPGEPLRVDFLDFAFVAATPTGAAPVSAFPDAAFAPADSAIAFNDGYTSSVFGEPGERLTVTLRPGVGEVTLAPSAAAQVVIEDGGALAVSGAQGDVNAALAGLVYTPPTGFLGETSIEIAVTDGAFTTMDAIALTVAGVAGLEPDIALRSLDATFFEDRLQFNWIDTPDRNASTPRAFKDVATLRVTNEGAGPLRLDGHNLMGPFALVDPDQLDGVTLGLGQSIDVAVVFDRSAFTERPNNVSGVVDGRLDILSDDPDTPVASVDLSAFWQRFDEGGWKPSVNEVWRVFGFGNAIPGLSFLDTDPSPLFTGGLYEAFDTTEVLSPHWRIADGVDEAQITMIARYSGPRSGSEPITIHRPFTKGATALTFGARSEDTQSLLPGVGDAAGGPGASFDLVFASARFTRETIPDIWQGDNVFSIAAANFSSDPNLNGKGDIPPDAAPEAIYGHWLRIFQAFDAGGAAIPNVYLGFQDFIGINGDFNDTMFVIEGVEPVSTAPVTTAPTAVATVGGRPFAFGVDNRIRIDDADVGLTPRFNAYLSVGHGTLNVSATGATVGGDGTGALHLFGTPPQVNDALRSLVYTADPTFSGVDTLRIVANDRALSDEDFVSIAVAPAPGRLGVTELDDAAADARLVFTNINPDSPTLRPGQSFRDKASFEIVNEGGQPLSILNIKIADESGFVIVGPVPATLAAGARATVTVAFVGLDPTSRDRDAPDPRLAKLPEFYETTLRVATSVGDAEITLAGLAQFASENGQEPQPFQIARAFGYATDIPFDALPEQGDPAFVEIIGDEVLAPYFTALDGNAPVEVVQLAAFLGTQRIGGERVGDVARLHVHDPASAASRVELFAQDGAQNQSVLPMALGGVGETRAAFAPTGVFGVHISVDGRPDYATWSDPGANETDPALRRNDAPLTGDGDATTPDGGHILRYFKARAGDGSVIPGVYLAIQDYPGAGNFDFNDHVFLVRNVAPIANGALPAAMDRNGDGVNDALTQDFDGDGVVAFFDPDDAPLRVEAEAFTLVQGFKTVARAAASGGVNIEASDGGEQIAAHVFGGRSGVYDLRLGHFDENDGVASMRVLVNDVEIDAFLWNRDTGSPSPAAAALIERQIGDVALRPGDVIELRGFGAPGEPIRTDYLDFAFSRDLAPPAPFRVEAEDFALLEGFTTRNRSAASGGINIEAVGAGEQVARLVFDRPSGVYDLGLGYFDENDGVASMRVLVNGAEIESFRWARDTGSANPTVAALVEQDINDVALRFGDTIELRGFGAPGEPLRTDYLDFTWLHEIA